MPHFRYYSVIGNNGGVVASSYDRALHYKQYLRGHVYTKKFSDFEEAEEYTLDHISEKAPFGCPIPLHCKINEIIFISKLLKSC
mgnify:CR=1 FL=1